MIDLASNGDVRSATKMLGSALADLMSPSNANATGGGITGTTKKFSPFGGVDVKVYMTANSPTQQNGASGAPVQNPPSALVKTQLGALVAKVNVQFSVTPGSGTITPTTPVATDATGVASSSSWVINPGANTAQAVGTYADPTVTFAAAPAGSSFPQAVAVDPSGGITYNANGGDVVPYGASYTFLDGPQGHDAGFEAAGLLPHGLEHGEWSFRELVISAAPCARSTAIRHSCPNHAWVVGTDMLLLKSFPLPAGWTAPLVVNAAIDNDIVVYHERQAADRRTHG